MISGAKNKWFGAIIVVCSITYSCALKSKYSAGHAELAASPFNQVGSLPSGMWGRPMMAWDPDIIREGSKVHLFFASLFCLKDNEWHYSWNPDDFKACSIDKVFFSIGYGFKDESLSSEFTFRRTPLIDPGTPGAWDDDQIETPEMIQHGSKIHIFYSSMPKNPHTPGTKSARYQIGVASLDLADYAATSMEDLFLNRPEVRLQRNANNPIVPRSKILDRFDRENTQEPTVIYRNGRFELFYLGIRANKKGTNLPLDDDESLLDSTADFKEFGLGRVCLDDEFRKRSCSDDATEIDPNVSPLVPVGSFTNMPNIYWHQNLYYLFYTAAGGQGDNHQGEKIFFRTSPDLVTWSQETVAVAGNESTEYNWGVHSPAVAVIDSPQGFIFEIVYQAWGVGSRGDDNPYCIKNRFRVSTNTDPTLCNSTALGFARQ